MDSLRRLEELFAHFPGIGPRQARRFVYYLLGKSPASIKELTELIADVRASSVECTRCHRFFVSKNKGISACSICTDQSRDQASLMIVARDSDFESVEKSGAYRGLYFILGGTVPILDKEPERRIRLMELSSRLGEAGSPVAEIILSLNTTPDGENTAEIVRERVQSLKPGMKLTVLGRGLSTGAELEYVDSDTIRNALENRH